MSLENTELVTKLSGKSDAEKSPIMNHKTYQVFLTLSPSRKVAVLHG